MKNNFQPIFDYLDEMRVEIKEEIVSAVEIKINEKIDKLQTTVDSLASDVKNFNASQAVQAYRRTLRKMG